MLPEGQPKARDLLEPLAFPLWSSIILMVATGSFNFIVKIFS